MKNIFAIILLLLSTSVLGQTAQEYLQKGIVKQNNQDYKGALSEYNKAISKDRKLIDAYFNRGIVKLLTNNFNGAIIDFNKTILLNDNFIEAYYSRALANVKMEKYEKALPDLNKVIEDDETLPDALTLRGQLLNALGDKEAGCMDFHRAKDNGDGNAEKYIIQFCD